VAFYISRLFLLRRHRFHKVSCRFQKLISEYSPRSKCQINTGPHGHGGQDSERGEEVSTTPQEMHTDTHTTLHVAPATQGCRGCGGTEIPVTCNKREAPCFQSDVPPSMGQAQPLRHTDEEGHAHTLDMQLEGSTRHQRSRCAIQIPQARCRKHEPSLRLDSR